MSYVRFIVTAVLLTAAAALGVAQAGVGYPLGQWATVAAFERDTGASITEYSGAPVLQAMVADGTLPAVADRLPLEPAVVAPAEAVGQYGGTWRRVATRPTDNRLADRMGYEPLLRRARDGTAVVANIAHRWEASPDGTQFTFHLREGMKWSDGAPFTADDIVYQFENVYSNEEVTPVFPSWLTVKTVPPTLTKVDDQTIIFTFADTNGLFEEVLTFRGDGIFAPKHYLEQFHADFGDKDKLNEAAQAEGFELWHQRYGQLANVTLNQDLPTIRPWRLATEATGVTRQIAERNAFYWKVDTVGQQLPYIDRIAIDVVESGEAANFKAMAGEIDMQSRYMSFGNFTLFVENESAEDYQVRQWINPIPDALKFNLTYEDEVLRELFNERDFRIAMSKAIDRQEIGDLVYLGVAIPWQAVPVEADPFFVAPGPHRLRSGRRQPAAGRHRPDRPRQRRHAPAPGRGGAESHHLLLRRRGGRWRSRHAGADQGPLGGGRHPHLDLDRGPQPVVPAPRVGRIHGERLPDRRHSLVDRPQLVRARERRAARLGARVRALVRQQRRGRRGADARDQAASGVVRADADHRRPG